MREVRLLFSRSKGGYISYTPNLKKGRNNNTRYYIIN